MGIGIGDYTSTVGMIRPSGDDQAECKWDDTCGDNTSAWGHTISGDMIRVGMI